MKHQIVITRGQFIVENMMSKIATPSELRARLAKKFPGKYALYFRVVDPQYGMFFVKGQRYFWFIDSCKEPKQRKPKPKSDTHLFRDPKQNSFVCPTQDPYKLYEGDVVSLANMDTVKVQPIHGHPDHEIYYVQCVLNDKLSWVNAITLGRIFDAATILDLFTKMDGKTIRITEAVRYHHDPTPDSRGLLSGKPLTWYLKPREYPGYRYKYEIVQ